MAPSLLLLALAAPLGGGHLDLHPKDAAFVFEVPDVQALTAAYGQTAWAKLLAEPELEPGKELLEGMIGDLPTALGLSEEPWSTLMSDLQAVSVSGPSMAAAFSLYTDLSMGGGTAGAEVLALMDLSSPEAAAAFQAGLLDLFKPGEASVTNQLEWILSAEEAGLPMDLRCAREGARLELSLGGVRSVPAGEATMAAPFAAEGTVVFRSRLQPQWEALPGASDLVATLGEAFLGPWFTMASRGGEWQVTLAGDRFTTRGRFPATPGARVLGGKALAASRLEVDEDTGVQMTMSLDADALGDLLGLSQDSAGQDPALAGLVSSLGDHATVTMARKVSVLAAPPVLIRIPLKDAAAASAGLAALMGQMGEQLAGMATVSEKPYRKIPIYTLAAVEGVSPDLDLPLPIDIGGLVKPSFAVTDDALLVSTTSSSLKRAIRAKAGDAGAVVETPVGVGMASHEDWMGVLAAAYDGVIALAGGFLGGMTAGLEELESEAPVNPLDALPSSDLLRKHFSPAVRSRRLEGEVVHYHSESSFGPEFLLVIPAAVLGFTTSEPAPMVYDLDDTGTIEAGDGR